MLLFISALSDCPRCENINGFQFCLSKNKTLSSAEAISYCKDLSLDLGEWNSEEERQAMSNMPRYLTHYMGKVLSPVNQYSEIIHFTPKTIIF